VIIYREMKTLSNEKGCFRTLHIFKNVSNFHDVFWKGQQFQFMEISVPFP
jgi:hypothetical protein